MENIPSPLCAYTHAHNYKTSYYTEIIDTLLFKYRILWDQW